jgi:hypothetical protein
MSNPSASAEAPWVAGLRGARATAAPALVLQAVALGLVLAYYFHPPTHATIESLAQLHERAGLWFSILSTGLFGGLIPVLYLRLRPATRSRFTVAGAIALIGFWSYKGIEVDLWYRLLAHTVGQDHRAATIATKTFFDQFVYCPVFAVPATVIFYDWVEKRFAGDAVLAEVRGTRWYRRRVLPVLISNLGVWVPAVCIIYALPTSLQLPLQNLVLCFFTLLLAHVLPNEPRG